MFILIEEIIDKKEIVKIQKTPIYFNCFSEAIRHIENLLIKYENYLIIENNEDEFSYVGNKDRFLIYGVIFNKNVKMQ